MKVTLESLQARVEALEVATGPLQLRELLELVSLEAAYASAFPRPIAEMTTGELDDLIRYHGSVAAGRYGELRARRGRTAEETAKSQERLAQLETMTAEEIDAFLAAQAKLLPSEIGR